VYDNCEVVEIEYAVLLCTARRIFLRERQDLSGLLEACAWLESAARWHLHFVPSIADTCSAARAVRALPAPEREDGGHTQVRALSRP
jgi:hypothetical protein